MGPDLYADTLLVLAQSVEAAPTPLLPARTQQVTACRPLPTGDKRVSMEAVRSVSFQLL